MKRHKTSKKPPAEQPPKPEPPEIQDGLEPDEGQKVSTAQDKALLKEQRRLEGEAAMDEYLAEQQAKRARMAKLRAQRLAKEAEDKAKPKTVTQKQ
jgi:hypothetical protein